MKGLSSIHAVVASTLICSGCKQSQPEKKFQGETATSFQDVLERLCYFIMSLSINPYKLPYQNTACFYGVLGCVFSVYIDLTH